MQYLLSEYEYESLVPIEKLKNAGKALDAAQAIIVELAGVNCGNTYCDLCPISDIGADVKEERPSHEVSKLICMKPRRYSE